KDKRWFFREFMEGRSRNRYNRVMRIVDHPWTVFAGDVKQLGIGKLIAIKYSNPMNRNDEIRLGVLSDTGQAFQKNLYQLDLFGGVYDSKQQFKKQLRTLPNTSYAYFLVKK
ncbi:hypothetical protein KAU11_02325, partial [Candidatus Babeliales bacterium]|nr:hypothetical protein [Candidatus Babeliales bacterium]